MALLCPSAASDTLSIFLKGVTCRDESHGVLPVGLVVGRGGTREGAAIHFFRHLENDEEFANLPPFQCAVGAACTRERSRLAALAVLRGPSSATTSASSCPCRSGGPFYG